MNRYKFDKKNHIHLLDGKPLIGTSSAASVLSKPLTYWASGLAVKELGVTDPKVLTKIKSKKATEEERLALYKSCSARHEEIKAMSLVDYITLLNKAYTAHATNLKEKASEGTDLHEVLETYVKWVMGGRDTKDSKIMEILAEKRIQPFVDWADREVDYFIWSEAHCWSERLWIGGITDCAAKLKNGKTIIIDFKSSKEAYLSQHWQCIGYAIQVEENGWYDSEGNLVGKLESPIDYVCIVPFGAEKVEPQFYYNVEEGKKAFEAEIVLYKLLNQ